MAEELQYTSKYDGVTTDELLGYTQETKELDSNAYVKESKQLQSNEYVKNMKEQTKAEDAETVQVFDVEGVPHKISKEELISKAGIQLPSLEEIGGFVAYDTNGQALGLMSKEQVAEVVEGLIGTVTTEKSGLVDKNTGLFQRDFYSGDLNNFINGYTLFSGGTNVPVSGFYGIVEALNCGGYILQRAYNAANHKVYERVLWDAWRPWVALN